MKTFTTIALECDVAVTEDVVNQIIHCWLLKRTAGSNVAFEVGWTLYLFVEEFANICILSVGSYSQSVVKLTDTTLFSAEHTTRYTAAFDVFAVHERLIPSGTRLEGRRAMVQSAVE